jgi:hypothetical protein
MVLKHGKYDQNLQKKLGPIALIQSGTGTVVGLAKIVDVIELTESLAQKNYKKMGMTLSDAVSCTGQYAWVLSDIVKFKTPVNYKHPSGAVTWVTLDKVTTQKVLAEAKSSIRSNLE